MSKILDHLKAHKWGYLLAVLIVFAVAIQTVYAPVDLDILRGDLQGSVVVPKTVKLFKVQLPALKVNDFFEKNFMDSCSDCLRGSDITLVAGSLPPGLQLNNGYLKGKPTKPGTYNFDLRLGKTLVRSYIVTTE